MLGSPNTPGGGSPGEPPIVTTAKDMFNRGLLTATAFANLMKQIGWQNQGQLIAVPGGAIGGPGASPGSPPAAPGGAAGGPLLGASLAGPAGGPMPHMAGPGPSGMPPQPGPPGAQMPVMPGPGQAGIRRERSYEE